MRRVVLWAWSLTALFSGTAHADCVASYFSQPKVQHMTVDEARRSMIKDAAYVRCLTHTSARARPSKIGVADLPVKSAVPISTKVAKVDDLPPEYVVQMYGMLRRDFNDVWLFQKIKDVSDIEDAQGAEFSVSEDRIKNNTAWNVHAMAAGVYQIVHDRFPKGPKAADPNFIGLSLAAFVQVDRVRNSNLASQTNNVDEMKFGGSAEIGFDMLGGSHYFRARGAAVNDRITDTSSGSGVLEWIPIYDRIINSPLPLALPVTFVFGPELKVRYDNVIVNDATGTKEYLFRGGPQLNLRYKFLKEALPDNLKWLASLHGQTTYSWLTALNSNHTFSYFDTSLTYNLDPAGHLGLSGSYTNGRSEATGRKIDLWKAGLTGKW